MSENLLVLLLTGLVGVLYAALIAWFRWLSDGDLPPFAVTFGCGAAWAAFTWLRGWEESLYLLLVLAVLGVPQIIAWQAYWLLRRGDGEDDRRELR